MFFEKNGLKHGEFRLPFGPNEVNVNNLAWNRDGDALAVCCKERATGGAGRSHMLIYTCSNYHWSLKQAWQFPGELLFFRVCSDFHIRVYNYQVESAIIT